MRVIIVAAHLDSINLAGGPSAAAPGADDNASGSAGVIEIARVFKDRDDGHELRFILFGAGELGLLGSRHYIRSRAAPERYGLRGRAASAAASEPDGTRAFTPSL